MIESREWSNLFKKNETSKISVEVQTSPKRNKSPEKHRQIKHTTSVQTKTAESDNNNIEETSKTIKLIYDRPKTKVQPRYEGEILRGFRHGIGRYYFEDGGYYEG
jgi:hypothetical protein